MKPFREDLLFNTAGKVESINVTSKVESLVKKSGIGVSSKSKHKKN